MVEKTLAMKISAGLLVVAGVVGVSQLESVNAFIRSFTSEKTQQAPVGFMSGTAAPKGAVIVDHKVTPDTVKAPEETVAKPEAIIAEKKVSTAAEEPVTPAKTTEAASAQALGSAEVAAAAKNTELSMPSFDLLRVEPDGSVLIAGRTKPLANVEVVAGSTVLAKTTANDRGEFVAVFDKALKAGDYEMVLRASMPDGTVMTSAETAVVAIPEDSNGQVLALVQAPGKPSRLITKTQETAEVAPAPTPKDTATDARPAPTSAQANTPDTAITDAPAIKALDSVEDKVAEAAKEVISPVTATLKPKVAAGKAKVSIEAVEIDGKTLFIAGRAKAGSIIRLYANDELLGDTLATPGGTFLMQMKRDLPVGDYVIRADQLTANRGDVVARAAVPFTRTAGEKIAAVAAPAARVEQAKPARANQAAATDAKAPKVDSAAAPATENADGTGQALKAVSGSVVIRNGDTLWHISKRVYGKGIRYTTIYKANQNQIKDPDMIWPGQVFDLPKGDAN